MSKKSKLAHDYALKRLPPPYSDEARMRVSEDYIAGFDQARELISKLHEEQGYGECHGLQDIWMLSDEGLDET